MLALALLVLLVDTDHVDAALAPDYLAILANAFDAGANFHGAPSMSCRKAIEYMGLRGRLTSGHPTFDIRILN